MHGPPLELHVDPKARPFAVHTPASVPIHWAKKVKSDLERDVELGLGWYSSNNGQVPTSGKSC